MSYISSNANRFYAAIEPSYGQAAAITAANRFPALRIQAHQAVALNKRLDKTGTRTFLGESASARRSTEFETKTYFTSWTQSAPPSYGVLFEAAMGLQQPISSGLSIGSVVSPLQLITTTPHGLSFGSAIACQNEVRFVTAIPNDVTIVINAAFSQTPAAGITLSPSITYRLGTTLPSVTLYDFWDPVTAISRIITGVAIDTLQILINGDLHEFAFRGLAADLVDSASFTPGTANLSIFPTEPPLGNFEYSIVPGHLGEAWLGTGNRFFTLTSANIQVENNIRLRGQEFGSAYPSVMIPGPRRVTSSFTLFAQDDAQTEALYTAAKTRNQVPAMLQLGQQAGQIMGIFLPAITPEIPLFDDSETRLQWQFKNNLAQGASDDELYIAFA